MITRACISINNKCNLKCRYCHFSEKKIVEVYMNIYKILDNIKAYVDKNDIEIFKIGFVGNGEPLLDYDELKDYILYLKDYIKTSKIEAYTITNGILIDKEKLEFFKENKVKVGFSIDGPKDIHNLNRCNSFDRVIAAIDRYREVFGEYPTMNVTVGKESLLRKEEVIEFFKKFNSKITFSRMIGKYGIELSEFRQFLQYAEKYLEIRKGKYDCTMYGGFCGVGIDNIFYANGKIYRCGNCIDLAPICDSDTALDDICMQVPEFDRKECYKEGLK